MGKMMQKAQKAQAEMQQEIEALRCEGTSGGGVVRATVDGQKNLMDLQISPEALEEADAEMVQDMVLAAIHEAQRTADEEVQKKVQALSQKLGLPPGMGL
jgi:hypothetical protein